jgi:hypothetical protein
VPHLDFAIVKKHPVAIVGGLLLVFALVFLLNNRNSAAASSAGAASGPDPTAALNAGTQVQLAGLQLTGQGQTLAERLAEATGSNQTQLAALTLQLQAQQDNNKPSFNLGALQTTLDAALQTHMSDNNLAGTLAGFNAQTSYAQIESNTQLGIAGDQTTANIAIAGINAQTQQVLAASQADVLKTVAQYQAGTAIAGYNAQVGIAQIAGKTAQNSSNNGLLGGIAGTIGKVIAGFGGFGI